MFKTALTVVALLGSASFVPAAFAAPAPATAGSYVAVDRPATITAIPGVVAAGARWEPVFSSVELQDGIVGTPDGSILIAMQDAEIVRRIDGKGASTIYVGGTRGAGALGMDNQGRLYGVVRKEPTMLAELAPDMRPVAQALPDGKGLGRLSDLVVDLKGGYYVSGGGFYYVNPQGVVTVLDTNIATNGIAMSPDGGVLYVTNGAEIVAFDVQADGLVKNRRVFNSLDGDGIADGMAVDAAGRLYVTCASGVHVISPQGRSLGVIPTHRRGTSVAFAGPGKKTLYLLDVGATTSDGRMLEASAGTRTNSARTLYKLDMIAAGYAGRPK
jgi:gluconolactonase